jgi:hypothetical protein
MHFHSVDEFPSNDSFKSNRAVAVSKSAQNKYIFVVYATSVI